MQGKGKKAEAKSKVKRAARMLLLKRHGQPGVKGWELKRILGKRYLDIIRILDERLGELGLTVKIIDEEGKVKGFNGEDLGKARFYVVLKEPPQLPEVKAVGWRIDDLACLSASILYIVSKRGRAPRKEIENILKQKIPKWRVERNIDRFIKLGYLMEDENEVIRIGWRTRAEIDEKKMMDTLMKREVEEKS